MRAFEWARGDPELWAIKVSRQRRRYVPPILVYKSDWWRENRGPPPGNEYRPLEEAPRLYLELARLGREALEIGLSAEKPSSVFSSNSRDPSGGERAEADDPDAVLGDPPVYEVEPDPLLYAALDRGVQRKVLRFVRAYGPLRGLKLDECWFDGRDRSIDGMPVSEFLREAVALFTAARQLVTESEPSKSKALVLAINDRLQHVHPWVYHVEGDASFVAGHWFVDLLGVIWFQFFSDVASARPWGLCKNRNCGEVFLVARQGQEFCTPGCRRRYHVNKAPSTLRKRKEAAVGHR